jgi:prevent-host-death family protein
MTEFMKAGKFKEQCLKVMDRVKRTKRRIVITKRNVPVAQIVPIEEKETSLFGSMKGTIHVKGNIIKALDEAWNACR